MREELEVVDAQHFNDKFERFFVDVGEVPAIGKRKFISLKCHYRSICILQGIHILPQEWMRRQNAMVGVEPINLRPWRDESDGVRGGHAAEEQLAGDLLREERRREPTEGDGGLDEVGGGVRVAHGVLEGVEPLGLGRGSTLGAVLPHFVTHVEVKLRSVTPFSGLFPA